MTGRIGRGRVKNVILSKRRAAFGLCERESCFGTLVSSPVGMDRSHLPAIAIQPDLARFFNVEKLLGIGGFGSAFVVVPKIDPHTNAPVVLPWREDFTTRSKDYFRPKSTKYVWKSYLKMNWANQRDVSARRADLPPQSDHIHPVYAANISQLPHPINANDDHRLVAIHNSSGAFLEKYMFETKNDAVREVSSLILMQTNLRNSPFPPGWTSWIFKNRHPRAAAATGDTTFDIGLDMGTVPKSVMKTYSTHVEQRHAANRVQNEQVVTLNGKTIYNSKRRRRREQQSSSSAGVTVENDDGSDDFLDQLVYEHPHIIRLVGVDLNPYTLSITGIIVEVGTEDCWSRVQRGWETFDGLPSAHTKMNETAQMVRAMHYLHFRGVAYRDMKVDNMVLGCNPPRGYERSMNAESMNARKLSHLKMIDFGLSRWIFMEPVVHFSKSTLWHYKSIASETDSSNYLTDPSNTFVHPNCNPSLPTQWKIPVKNSKVSSHDAHKKTTPSLQAPVCSPPSFHAATATPSAYSSSSSSSSSTSRSLKALSKQISGTNIEPQTWNNGDLVDSKRASFAEKPAKPEELVPRRMKHLMTYHFYTQLLGLIDMRAVEVSLQQVQFENAHTSDNWSLAVAAAGLLVGRFSIFTRTAKWFALLDNFNFCGSPSIENSLPYRNLMRRMIDPAVELTRDEYGILFCTRIWCPQCIMDRMNKADFRSGVNPRSLSSWGTLDMTRADKLQHNLMVKTHRTTKNAKLESRPPASSNSSSSSSTSTAPSVPSTVTLSEKSSKKSNTGQRPQIIRPTLAADECPVAAQVRCHSCQPAPPSRVWEFYLWRFLLFSDYRQLILDQFTDDWNAAQTSTARGPKKVRIPISHHLPCLISQPKKLLGKSQFNCGEDVLQAMRDQQALKYLHPNVTLTLMLQIQKTTNVQVYGEVDRDAVVHLDNLNQMSRKMMAEKKMTARAPAPDERSKIVYVTYEVFKDSNYAETRSDIISQIGGALGFQGLDSPSDIYPTAILGNMLSAPLFSDYFDQWWSEQAITGPKADIRHRVLLLSDFVRGMIQYSLADRYTTLDLVRHPAIRPFDCIREITTSKGENESKSSEKRFAIRHQFGFYRLAQPHSGVRMENQVDIVQSRAEYRQRFARPGQSLRNNVWQMMINSVQQPAETWVADDSLLFVASSNRGWKPCAIDQHQHLLYDRLKNSNVNTTIDVSKWSVWQDCIAGDSSSHARQMAICLSNARLIPTSLVQQIIIIYLAFCDDWNQRCRNEARSAEQDQNTSTEHATIINNTCIFAATMHTACLLFKQVLRVRPMYFESSRFQDYWDIGLASPSSPILEFYAYYERHAQVFPGQYSRLEFKFMYLFEELLHVMIACHILSSGLHDVENNTVFDLYWNLFAKNYYPSVNVQINTEIAGAEIVPENDEQEEEEEEEAAGDVDEHGHITSARHVPAQPAGYIIRSSPNDLQKYMLPMFGPGFSFIPSFETLQRLHSMEPCVDDAAAANVEYIRERWATSVACDLNFQDFLESPTLGDIESLRTEKDRSVHLTSALRKYQQLKERYPLFLRHATEHSITTASLRVVQQRIQGEIWMSCWGQMPQSGIMCWFNATMQTVLGSDSELVDLVEMLLIHKHLVSELDAFCERHLVWAAVWTVLLYTCGLIIDEEAIGNDDWTEAFRGQYVTNSPDRYPLRVSSANFPWHYSQSPQQQQQDHANPTFPLSDASFRDTPTLYEWLTFACNMEQSLLTDDDLQSVHEASRVFASILITWLHLKHRPTPPYWKILRTVQHLFVS